MTQATGRSTLPPPSHTGLTPRAQRLARLLPLVTFYGLAACGQQSNAPSQPPQKAVMQSAPTPNQKDAPLDSVHSFMTKRVDPYADTIWGIGNGAMDEDGRLSPAKMSPDGWREMAATAAKLGDAAAALGRLQPIRAVHTGERVVDEGKPRAPTAAHIQAAITADPALFRSMSESLAHRGRDLAVAARARDARTAGRLVDEIDGVCEGCHLQFWYPDDRKSVAAIAKQ